MKKRVLFALALSLLMFFALSVTASAGHDSYGDDYLDEFESVIPPESGVALGDGLLDSVGFELLFADLINAVSGSSSRISSFILMIIGLSAVFAVCDGVFVLDNPLLKRNIGVGIAAVASVSIFSALYGIIQGLSESLTSVTDFFSSLIPILTAISAASASPGTALVQATNMNITLALIQKFCTGMLLPLVFALFSLALAASTGEGGAASVAKGIKNVFLWGVGIVCTLLSAAIGLQSLLASAKDTAALRAARYAASGMIPIVGTSVASALSTLAGGMAFIKSTVGVGSIAVIISLSLAPLVSVLLYRLAFSLGIIILEFLGSEGGVRCFSAFRGALDALLAVYAVSVLVCIIQLVIFIKSGAMGV